MPLGKIVGKGRIFLSRGRFIFSMRPAVPIAEERDTAGVLRFRKFFPFDEACRQAAARGLGEKALLELGRQQQVASLFEDGRAKVLAGETSPEEMLRVLGPLEKK